MAYINTRQLLNHITNNWIKPYTCKLYSCSEYRTLRVVSQITIVRLWHCRLFYPSMQKKQTGIPWKLATPTYGITEYGIISGCLVSSKSYVVAVNYRAKGNFHGNRSLPMKCTFSMSLEHLSIIRKLFINGLFICITQHNILFVDFQNKGVNPMITEILNGCYFTSF